ncbi:MAG: hypothetical protein HQ583_06715 [Candidatus Abyssubacteria bacterium]|nr:hypothetical protein [Candidatus Abyssubacteria bacterium]
MALTGCPECGGSISEKALSCPHCGNPMKPAAEYAGHPYWRGYEWKSQARILGWPLVHVAWGRDRETGRLLVAKGIIAIGQFGVGLITIAQFGIGFLFAFGQFTGGWLAIGQFALGVYFGLGQFATGMTAIGQFAFGEYVLAQMGYGKYVWSTKIRDPEAIEYFRSLLQCLRNFRAG